MVLVVEDEPSSRRALKQLLKAYGYEASVAASAEEALTMVDFGGPPNFALIDINLPGMNGVELANQFHQIYPKLPCVLMTANDEASNEQIRSGSRETTLRKPLDVPRLLSLIGQSQELFCTPKMRSGVN